MLFANTADPNNNPRVGNLSDKQRNWITCQAISSATQQDVFCQ